MSANERPEQEDEGAPGADKTRRPGAQPSDGVHEVPLFLRGRSDGRKGNAQDEKDEAAE